MKGPLSLPWNMVLKAPLASCRVSGDNSWARSSDLWGPLKICSSATETRVVELFHGHCFGAHKEGGRGGGPPNDSLLMPLQVPRTFKPLIHLLYASSFPRYVFEESLKERLILPRLNVIGSPSLCHCWKSLPQKPCSLLGLNLQ